MKKKKQNKKYILKDNVYILLIGAIIYGACIYLCIIQQ